MKKLIIILLFIPLGLFSQTFGIVPNKDRIQIRHLYSGFNYSEILLESYYYDESRKNFRHTKEWLNGSFSDIMEKSFDLNGTLREELLSGKQNYLRLFNKWGKLKVEILLNEDGFKDGIETFWRDEYNDYKPDPPLWKKTEITYSNGNFVSSKTFAYKSDAVDYEVILLNEQTESILTVDLRFYLSKRYTNGNRGEYTHSRIYKNGVYTGLNGQGGKAGKDREWWANGNLQKEINYKKYNTNQD